MKLGPKTIALFSPPTQRFLKRFERRRPWSRQEVIARLQSAERPPLAAVVEFEMKFGGLVFGPAGKRKDIKLGVDYRPPRSREPSHPDTTMIPIGLAHDECDLLYMNEAGEVVSHVDSIVMKSSSIVRYIEQEVVWYVPRWRAPRFYVDIRPAMGERLASALGLSPFEPASDCYDAWWEAEGMLINQVLFPESWKAGHTSVLAGSCVEVVRALEKAKAIEPRARFALGATPRKERTLTEEQATQIPPPDFWEARADTIGYDFGNESANLIGRVWVVRKPGACEIHQYRIRRKEGRAPRLLEWGIITAEGMQSHQIDYFSLD